MDYSALLKRSWDVVWNNKWLILLGFLVVLGSGGSGGGSNFRSSGNFGDFGNANGNFTPPDFGNDNFIPRDFGGFPGFDEQTLNQFLTFGVPIIIAVLCLLFAVAIAFSVIGRIASGGLIAGVDQIEMGVESSFGKAWGAGWQKGWRLIGIGLLAALPGLVFLIVALAMIVPIIGVATNLREAEAAFAGGGIILVLIGLGCLTALVSVPLAALRALADRAALLEDTGVFASYGRAWEVLKENFGQAFLLFLIQLGAQIALGVILFLPSIILTLCCIFIPVLWAVGGLIQAYFSTMWTLAWRQWTNREGASGEPAVVDPSPAPAV